MIHLLTVDSGRLVRFPWLLANYSTCVYNNHIVKAYFSKRHEQAIADKKIAPHFTVACRTSVVRLLSQYSNKGGWDNDENYTFSSAEEDLKTFYGTNELKVFDFDSKKRVPVSLYGFILGCYPTEVLDAIESWLDQNPTEAARCEKELNDAFVIHNTPWRVINGQVILVDSDYLQGELKTKAIQLLKENMIGGALEEYQGAINDLTAGESKDAIAKAHKSIESVMKAVLQTDEPLRYGQLLSRLIGSQIIPEYYEDFFKNFEQLALGIGKERNLPGRGHGQGRLTTEVPASLAEFSVNLAGAMNVFLVKHWIETKQPGEKQSTIEPEDIPF
jgi:hypothetical protein